MDSVKNLNKYDDFLQDISEPSKKFEIGNNK